MKAKLVRLINWNASIQAFKDKDTAVNGGDGPGSMHAWEGTHPWGPVNYTQAGNVAGTHYDEVLKDFSESDPHYHDPHYGDFDPYAQ